MVVKKKSRTVKVGPLTELNDSIKDMFKREMVGTKGDPPKGGPYRDGDRIMYRGQPWFVDGKDGGGGFVAIRDTKHADADGKHTSQRVPRATLFPMLPDPGNGAPPSEAQENYKEFQKKQAQRREMFSDKDLTAPPAKRGRAANGEARPPRESKPKDPNAIPLKKICAEVNVDPKIARRLLRGDKTIPRPEGRWEFNPKDVERIKKVITQPV